MNESSLGASTGPASSGEQVGTEERCRSAVEQSAAIDSCAVFDVSDRSVLELVGPERTAFLHRTCTNDINRLAAGQGCEAFFCNAKGRVLAHVFIFQSDEQTWVECVSGEGVALATHLGKYQLLDEFTITNRSGEFSQLLVTGTEAAACLRAIGCDELPSGLMCHVSADIADESSEGRTSAIVRIRSVWMVPAPAFLLSMPTDSGPSIRERLRQAGAILSGTESLNALRIEAGFPISGRDLTIDHLAQEAGRTESTISFQKGCYLGQEPIARIHALGHVNRTLAIFRVEPDAMPGESVGLTDPDGKREVGRISSLAWSARYNSLIGLGTIRVQCSTPGSVLHLSETGGTATVISASDHSRR